MSLRGIESQMIINRTSDYAREASAQIRRGELAQDYLAHQNKVLSDIQKEQVSHLESKEAARIRLDERKEPDQGASGKKKKKKPLASGEGQVVRDDRNAAARSEHLLDIEI